MRSRYIYYLWWRAWFYGHPFCWVLMIARLYFGLKEFPCSPLQLADPSSTKSCDALSLSVSVERGVSSSVLNVTLWYQLFWTSSNTWHRIIGAVCGNTCWNWWVLFLFLFSFKCTFPLYDIWIYYKIKS